ncbi:MAG: response regulator, partial [Calditrichia bacterium]
DGSVVETDHQEIKEDINGTESLLVVEDEEGMRKLITDVLSAYGYRISTAENGSDALARYGDKLALFDMIITDVVMPQMSGKEFAQALKQISPRSRILFMSGYTDEAISKHGILDLEYPFIQKPFAPLEIARKVREILDSPAKK